MGEQEANTTPADAQAAAGIADHYKALHTQCGLVLNETFENDTDTMQARTHSFISEMASWCSTLSPRPESDVLKAATTEFQFALLAVSQGHYRHAFVGLRLFLELALSAVHFSCNRLELNEWLLGNRDVSWSCLSDEENGVLSRRYAKAFFPELSDVVGQYRGMAAAAYRECSEHVHGNANTYTVVPQQLAFNQDIFAAWHEKADAITLVVTMACCLRYLPELDEAETESLREHLLNRIGHVKPIRARLGGPVETA